MKAAIAFLCLCLLAGATSVWAMNHQRVTPPIAISQIGALPARFGDWSIVKNDAPAVNPSTLDENGHPVAVYDRIVSQTYRRPDGASVMLMLAYKRVQQQEDRVHRPELCYFGQGYMVSQRQPVRFGAARREIPATAFLANSSQRAETVLYWIRTGNKITDSPANIRAVIFLEGLRSRLTDGVLVRASILRDPRQPQNLPSDVNTLKGFLAGLLDASSARTQELLAGPVGGRQV